MTTCRPCGPAEACEPSDVKCGVREKDTEVWREGVVLCSDMCETFCDFVKNTGEHDFCRNVINNF
jgi:hypothetical protein